MIEMSSSPVRILFLSANPDNTPGLNVQEEFKKIDATIQASKYREYFNLMQAHATSLADLQHLLLRFRPNIIHFSGHGSEKGSLVFENETGEAEEAPPEALANLFRIINDGSSIGEKICCVVLSACYSNKKQAQAITQHVDCVVGISEEVHDSSAIKFSTGFYRGLGYGKSVSEAFELGVNELELYNDPDKDILKLRHRAGIDPTKMYLVRDPNEPTDAASDNKRIAEEIRNCGLEHLTSDYFKEHKTTERDIEYWKKGFPFKLEAIKERRELRRNVVDLIEGKLHEQMAMLLTGESGASKSTILMEMICDYLDKEYFVLYNLGSSEIRNAEQMIGNLKELLRTGKKVLVAIDDVHAEKSAGIFYVIDQLSNFELRQNMRFVLTARLPDYDWLIRLGLETIQESSYKNAVKKFRDDQTFRYQLPFFSIDDIRRFIEKYVLPAPSEEASMALARRIYDSTSGNPVLVKFGVFGDGLRRDVEDRVEFLLKEPKYMTTTLALSILSVGGEKTVDDLLESMEIRKYATRLEYATLYRSADRVWKTIHTRWDIELFKLLFAEETDEITLDRNVEYLDDAIRHIFGAKDEKLTVSVIQTLYNTISVNKIIPVRIVHKVVSKNLPDYLSAESQAMIYGVIMPTSFLMHGEEEIAEELSNRALLIEVKNPEVYYNLALNFVAFGKLDKAIELCDKAIHLGNTNADIWYTKACLHVHRGDVEKALHDLDRAVKIDGRYSALAKEESFFEAIRTDARFLAIVNR